MYLKYRSHFIIIFDILCTARIYSGLEVVKQLDSFNLCVNSVDCVFLVFVLFDFYL